MLTQAQSTAEPRTGSTTVTAALAAALILGALSLGAAGCGGGGDDGPNAAEKAAERRVELTGGGRTARGSAGRNEAPKGSPLFVREIYRQFPPPEPVPGVKGSADAIDAGEKACAGKTPSEVEEAYFPIAVEKGNLDAESEEGRMIAEVDRFEANADREVSFTSGQLAADAYRKTLPGKLADSGYQGCVYALARDLERRLAAGEK